MEGKRILFATEAGGTRLSRTYPNLFSLFGRRIGRNSLLFFFGYVNDQRFMFVKNLIVLSPVSICVIPDFQLLGFFVR
jgi:hypothetical protein